MADHARILGTLLLERGEIDRSSLDRALVEQKQTGERLGAALLRLGLIEEETLYRTLAYQLGLPFEPAPLEPSDAALVRVRPAWARRRGVLPLEVVGRDVRVAMVDPLDLETMDDLQFQCGGRVRPVAGAPSAIRTTLARVFPAGGDGGGRGRGDPKQGGEREREEGAPREREPGRGSGGQERPGAPDDVSPEAGGEQGERRAPEHLDRLLRRAASNGASDLHLEPDGDGFAVRERIDGILRPVPASPGVSGAALLSRIKVLGGMDIAVKLRPQDGGFAFREGGRSVSVRVSTLPVQGGEKAVLRLLDPDSAPAGLEQVGLLDRDLEAVRRVLRAGSGVLLTAGPTGSGKSSTLSAAVGELDRDETNVVTLEDPVEYRIPGVSQVQVHPRAGLTFPAALRAVLRQDPDVVMIGEIRDRETAEIAMAAAVTGHLVLSTIHTIDAPSGITRLLHMGVPPYLVAGGLAGIVSQRLVRRVCPACGGREKACDACPDGYRGRTGIFQVLVVTEAIREEVVRGSSTSVFRRRARAAGMGSMADDARRKVAEGITSPHEVARVLREDPGEALPCRRCGRGVPPESAGCPFCGQPVARRCRCGERVRDGWRFCAACLRPAPPEMG
jgi:type IV pilus assembly protein PilB